MKVNFIELKGKIPKQANCDKLLQVCDKMIKGSGNYSARYDIICSVYKQRRVLMLKNEEIVSFINKFRPEYFSVYQLIREGVVVYVGSSTNIESRIVSHTKDKDFDEVIVCVKDTKEEMLNLENALIFKFRPEYNKSANLRRVEAYGADPYDEDFIRLEDLLVELPIRRNAGNVLYNYFCGDSFKYEYGKLNTNGKNGISAYFIQESNSVLEGYRGVKPEKSKKIKPNDEPERFDLLSLIRVSGLEEYVEDFTTQGLWVFDNKFIFSLAKWRVVDRSKWYSISNPERFVDILNEHIRSKEGKINMDNSPVFTFGRYKHRLVEDVAKEDPKYIGWILRTFKEDEIQSLGLRDEYLFTDLNLTVNERLQANNS